MEKQAVTIWYLAMSKPEEHKKKPLVHPDFTLRECAEKQYEFNRFLYQFVGRHWQWTDKLSWSDQAWQTYVERDQLRTWVLYKEGSPAGYFELEKDEDNCVELAYFGLAKDFIGLGLGGGFLSAAIDEAWKWGAERVQVNTCSKDHPSALANYQARGFQIYEEKVSH